MIKTSRLSPLSMCNTATQLVYEVKIVPGSSGRTAQTLVRCDVDSDDDQAPPTGRQTLEKRAHKHINTSDHCHLSGPPPHLSTV